MQYYLLSMFGLFFVIIKSSNIIFDWDFNQDCTLDTLYVVDNKRITLGNLNKEMICVNKYMI